MPRVFRLAPALLLLLAAGPALAHSGHGVTGSLLAGFAHPLLGVDHLLAMLAVGLWAGLARSRALWAWPAAFVGGMLLGGALGMAGIALPLLEPIILASVLLLGLAALVAAQPPAWLGALAVLLLALSHGNAHGLEAPVAAGGLAYAAGFALSTALLHGLGLGVAVLAHRLGAPALARGLGLGVAAGGLLLAGL